MACVWSPTAVSSGNSCFRFVCSVCLHLCNIRSPYCCRFWTGKASCARAYFYISVLFLVVVVVIATILGICKLRRASAPRMQNTIANISFASCLRESPVLSSNCLLIAEPRALLVPKLASH
jgi:hypothetical protein